MSEQHSQSHSQSHYQAGRCQCGRSNLHCINCGRASLYAVKRLELKLTSGEVIPGFRCKTCSAEFRLNQPCTAPPAKRSHSPSQVTNVTPEQIKDSIDPELLPTSKEDAERRVAMLRNLHFDDKADALAEKYRILGLL